MFLNPQSRKPYSVLTSGQPVIIKIGYLCKASIRALGIGIHFYTATGTLLFSCRNKAVGITLEVHPQEGCTDCYVPKWPLKRGTYTYGLFAEDKGVVCDSLNEAGTVQVENGDFYGSGCLPAPEKPGVLIDYLWLDEKV